MIVESIGELGRRQRRVRAAASSIASGSPSSRRQIRARAAAFPSRRRNRPHRGRARNEQADRSRRSNLVDGLSSRPVAPSSPANGQHTSSPRSSGWRVVTSMRSAGHSASRRSTTRADAASTCSQLSSSSKPLAPDNIRVAAASADSLPSSCNPSAVARASGTSSALAIADRSTNQTPSGKRAAAALATCSARRVLPAPPGPFRVTRRLSSSCRWTSLSSCCRPMKLVRGRLSSVRVGIGGAAVPVGALIASRGAVREGRSRLVSRRASASRSRISSSVTVWPRSGP